MTRYVIRIVSTNNVPPRQTVRGAPHSSPTVAWLRMQGVASYKHDSLLETGYPYVRLFMPSPTSITVTYAGIDNVPQRIEYSVEAVELDMPCPTCRAVPGDDTCHLCYGLGFVTWADLPESFRS